VTNEPANPRDEFARLRVETFEHALCNPLARATTVRCLGILLFRYCSGEEFIRTGHVEAWPSVARIAAEAGMREDTATSALRQACDLGYLERVRIGSRGRGHTSRYRLIPHSSPALAKPPTAGGFSDRFLGARAAAEQVIYEFDAAITKPPIGTPGKPPIGRNKTPAEQGANPLKEPYEENPSRTRACASSRRAW
jgi:hypothetical protein